MSPRTDALITLFLLLGAGVIGAVVWCGAVVIQIFNVLKPSRSEP